MRLVSRTLLSIIIIIAGVLILNAGWNRLRGDGHRSGAATAPFSITTCDPARHHEIDDLIVEAAQIQQRSVVQEATNNLHDGSEQYRRRRGRHPPPGFDAWYKYAQKQRAVIVEEFFDQIYHDIEPFWGVDAIQTRLLVAGWSMIIKVRNRKVVQVPNKLLRTTVWVEMITQVASMLPDMDIPINHLDEARIIASYSVIEDAVARAASQREWMMRQEIETFEYRLSSASLQQDAPKHSQTSRWSRDPRELHMAMRDSCPHSAPLAQIPLPWTSQSELLNDHNHEDGPFVKNMTVAKSICYRPQLTVQHGALVRPATVDFTTTLMPLFTGSKLPLYNDIVIPEPSYYSEKPEFTGKDFWGDWSTYYPWKDKRHSLIWRGSATGGGMTDANWPMFHRHRLISHLNATETDGRLVNRKTRPVNDEEWLRSSADAGFTRLYCNDAHDANACPDLGSHYRLVNRIKMGSQYQHKYLPDVDGNSVSERFRAFLFSNSAPIKATIFDDWHDHRLIPWQHYVPTDISYSSLYDIMRYFLGHGPTCSHDAEGQAIADSGRAWAQQVLRKEDMVIYVHRVLLEYARVVHDDRDRLGYVADLLGEDDTWAGK